MSNKEDKPVSLDETVRDIIARTPPVPGPLEEVGNFPATMMFGNLPQAIKNVTLKIRMGHSIGSDLFAAMQVALAEEPAAQRNLIRSHWWRDLTYMGFTDTNIELRYMVPNRGHPETEGDSFRLMRITDLVVDYTRVFNKINAIILQHDRLEEFGRFCIDANDIIIERDNADRGDVTLHFTQ